MLTGFAQPIRNEDLLSSWKCGMNGILFENKQTNKKADYLGEKCKLMFKSIRAQKILTQTGSDLTLKEFRSSRFSPHRLRLSSPWSEVVSSSRGSCPGVRALMRSVQSLSELRDRYTMPSRSPFLGTITSSMEGGDVEWYIATASGPFWMVFAGRAICGLSFSLPIYNNEKEQTISQTSSYNKDARHHKSNYSPGSSRDCPCSVRGVQFHGKFSRCCH